MVQDTVAHSHDSMPVAGWHYPSTVADMQAWFATEAAYTAYLDWLRWPDAFVCPHCQSTSAGNPAQGVYRCRRCRRRVSVTAGTIFDKTRVPLAVWFEAAWTFATSKAGVSASSLHRVLPISSYQTAWAMLGKLRSLLTTADGERLSGCVEVDETLIGGIRPVRCGRGADGKVLVVGTIEVTAVGWRRARMSVIPDASAASLRAFITATIATGSTMVSDAWRDRTRGGWGLRARAVERVRLRTACARFFTRDPSSVFPGQEDAGRDTSGRRVAGAFAGVLG